MERMGLEEKHPTGKNRSEGKAEGFVPGWGQSSSSSRTWGWAVSLRSCKLWLLQTVRAAALSSAGNTKPPAGSTASSGTVFVPLHTGSADSPARRAEAAAHPREHSQTPFQI